MHTTGFSINSYKEQFFLNFRSNLEVSDVTKGCFVRINTKQNDPPDYVNLTVTWEFKQQMKISITGKTG